MTWVFLITALLVAIHLFGTAIDRRLDKAKPAAHSFGGGMAVAYVFLHLLPELEKGHKVFGHSVHIIALAGFVAFAAAEFWIQRHDRDVTTGKLKLRIGLFFVYNWLIIYMLPEAVETSLGYTLLLAATLGLHLLSTDCSLRSELAQEFATWGRWVLAAGLVAGWVTDIFYEPVNPYVADSMTALLAGFIFSQVFRDEAPDPSHARFGWFVAGVILYAGLSLAT